MSGWKDWAIGEVVTESEFQSFVQDQVVQVYDDDTDRDNTLGANVAEGMMCYLKDIDETQVYDGTDWVSTVGDITEVVAGTALTGGGTSGSVTLNVDESEITLAQSQVTDLVSDLSNKASTTHATTHESGGSDEIEIAQSQVTGLDAGTEGQVVLSDGTSGLKFETGNLLREIVYFTSSGTFSKGDYPWLKAMRIKMVGGGGGGGGAPATGSNQFSMGSGGGGGAYAERFIADISIVASSETVTVGAGGAGGAAGLNEGTDGGQSSFGSLISANGGLRGLTSSPGGIRIRTAFAPVDTTTGADFFAAGVGGSYSYGAGDIFEAGGGGASFLSTANNLGNIGAFNQSRNGAAGKGFGTGGNGSGNGFNQSDRFGGAGSDGIVILELFV